MFKEWYIQIDRHREGPYSFEQLKKDLRINPDTLVWKKGFKEWLPIRNVPELKELFEEKITPPQDQQETLPLAEKKCGEEGVIVADYQSEPPPYLLWILIVVALFLFLIFR